MDFNSTFPPNEMFFHLLINAARRSLFKKKKKKSLTYVCWEIISLREII